LISFKKKRKKGMRLKTPLSLAALTLTMLTLLFVQVQAYAQARLHEFSAYGEGGLALPRYSLPAGVSSSSSSSGVGGGGLGYSFLFTDNIGLRTGVGASLLRSTVHLGDSFTSAIALTDEYYEPAELRSTFSGYVERQSVVMLQLPLLLHYQSKAYRRKLRYYARAGLRIELPLMGRYQARSASLVNELYYPSRDVALRDPAYKGLGVFSGVSSTGSLKQRLSLTAVAEAGVKWKLGARAFLYVGLYAGYGVGSAVKPQNGDADFGVGSVPTSRYAPATHLTDRAALFAVGVKVEVSISRLFTQPMRINIKQFPSLV
jgi:hypothetical protein